jgi:hypothetical protein
MKGNAEMNTTSTDTPGEESLWPELDQLAQSETPASKHFCNRCKRDFKSAAALNMHKVRIHGPGWDTSRNFKHKRRKGKAWTPQHRANYLRTVRRKQRGNVAPKPAPSTDAMGEAGRAVMLAAQVLRSVMVGMKI